MRDPRAYDSSGDTANSGRPGDLPRPRLILGAAHRPLDLTGGWRERRRKRGGVTFEMDPKRTPPGGDPPAAA